MGFWFNGEPTKEGVTSPSGCVYLPAFGLITDVTHANCVAALADADLTPDGKRIITTFGEPELPQSQQGITYTAAQTAAAWGALVTDSAWVGHPEVVFVGPYISTGCGSQYYTDFIAAVDAGGWRRPDMIASEKYGIYNQTAASQAAVIIARFDADHAAYPTLESIGLGMSILGPGNQPPGPVPSDAYIFQVMDLLHAGFEARPWVRYYAWFIAGPNDWTPFRTSSGNNMLLYDTSTPPVATPIGAYWRDLVP